MVSGVAEVPFFHVCMWYIAILRLNSPHTYEYLSTEEQSLNLSPRRAEVSGVSWFWDVLVKRLQTPLWWCCVGWVFCFFMFWFFFLYIIVCLCVLLFSCPSCWLCCWSPPPPRSILALSRLTHPSCPTQAIPSLLPCPLQPFSSSPTSSFLLPRKQPMLWRQQVLERAARLRAVGSGLGNNVHLMSGKGGGSPGAAF